MVKLGDVAVRFGVWSNICMIQITNRKKKEESNCTKPFSTLSEPAGAGKEVWSDTNHCRGAGGAGGAATRTWASRVSHWSARYWSCVQDRAHCEKGHILHQINSFLKVKISRSFMVCPSHSPQILFRINLKLILNCILISAVHSTFFVGPPHKRSLIPRNPRALETEEGG